MDLETKEHMNAITASAMEAKELLDRLISGEDVKELDGDELKLVETRMLQLLHLKQYSKMYEYAFENWPIEGPDQTYIEIANNAKMFHEMVRHDAYKETLMGLFLTHHEITNVQMDETYENLMSVVKKQWEDAKLIQSEL